MKKLVILLMLIIPFALFSVDSSEILERVDERLNFRTDFSCYFSMIVYRAGENPEKTEMKIFTRPEADEEEQFLAVVVKPDVDKGTGYLGIGDNFWIYDPESRQFSHSTARDTVQDSDVNNDDLGVADYVNNYNVVSMGEGMLGSIPVYVLDLEAFTSKVDYEKIRLWVGKEDFLPYREIDYSISGRPMREVLAPKWKKIEGKYIYSMVIFKDLLKEGNRTILTFDQVSINPIPDSYFTKSYLEKLNR